MARPKLLTDEQLAEAARRLALADALSERRLKELVGGGKRERLLRARKAGEAALNAELREPVMVYHENALWSVQLEPEVRAGMLNQLVEIARMTLLRSSAMGIEGPSASIQRIGGRGEELEKLRNPYRSELYEAVTKYEELRTHLNRLKKPDPDRSAVQKDRWIRAEMELPGLKRLVAELTEEIRARRGESRAPSGAAEPVEAQRESVPVGGSPDPDHFAQPSQPPTSPEEPEAEPAETPEEDPDPDTDPEPAESPDEHAETAPAGGPQEDPAEVPAETQKEASTGTQSEAPPPAGPQLSFL
jgi:hypothetical protein